MRLRDLFSNKEERQRIREEEIKTTTAYLASMKSKYDTGLVRNAIIGSIQAIEDGKSPTQVKARITKYIAQVESAEKDRAYIISPPFYQVRPTQEEITQAEKEAKHKKKKLQADSLYSAWRARVKPILKDSLITNPEVLDGLSYATFRGGVHGGSFYDFSSQKNVVKKMANGNYSIEVHPGDTHMPVERVDNRKGEGYSIQEIAEKATNGLLEETRSEHIIVAMDGRARTIPGRRFALDTIKKLTGVDLRSNNKKNNLEKTLGATMLLSLFGGLFFLSFNITGNTIANFSQNHINLSGAVLLIISLVAGFFWVNKKL